MHHSRRKSGHGLPNTSSTDVRKAAVTATESSKYKRPVMTRKQTPQRLGRSQREREREKTESWEDERESFPQFCCRRVDQTASPQPASSVHYASSNYPFYSAGNPEPRDIIPRASPSRPSSILLTSPPATPGTGAPTYQHTSAISALRSLNVRPPSPPSPTGSSSNLWPFSRSAATSPYNSYSRPSAPYLSSTYDGGYYSAGGGGYNYEVNSGGMDRPLPSRNPSAYSRPRSIELVTPMVGR
ncbi:Ff.00g121880.m01.CDS01 [Fusarium sp. VM40]|nr:Ff.00g121880.m01.CDS01 [Fusarium sp. VM40]